MFIDPSGYELNAEDLMVNHLWICVVTVILQLSEMIPVKMESSKSPAKGWEITGARSLSRFGWRPSGPSCVG